MTAPISRANCVVCFLGGKQRAEGNPCSVPLLDKGHCSPKVVGVGVVIVAMIVDKPLWFNDLPIYNLIRVIGSIRSALVPTVTTPGVIWEQAEPEIGPPPEYNRQNGGVLQASRHCPK